MNETKQAQLEQAQQRFAKFLALLEEIEPEEVGLEEIDKMIAMLDDLEEKLQKIKQTPQ